MTSDNPFQAHLTSNSDVLSVDDLDIESSLMSRANSNSSSGLSAQYANKSSEDTVSELQTDPVNGICNQQDISLRRSVHGVNELEGEKPESLLLRFIKTFYDDPMILLLIGSAVISFLMGNIDDAISITSAVLIVVTVGFVQEYRSEQSLEALNKLVPEMAHLTRNGATETVMASALVPGDLVHFAVGDRIPADVRLTESVHLSIDESNLTGETNPVSKTTEKIDGLTSINQRTNIAFMA
ncbi:unnamed protein product [Ambrosiozyma monospora]|uniref:Unnamed protein product n=1 Tax=Ambrosiozyma monospora TaxID=43982 RepID=A0A9W6YWB7_AMBMO|nr:unnamed protein product [Ambrosiozyma monospora]